MVMAPLPLVPQLSAHLVRAGLARGVPWPLRWPPPVTQEEGELSE